MSETVVTVETEALLARKRRGLLKYSARARATPHLAFLGRALAALVMCIGALDAVSTDLALKAGGVEANAVMRFIMEVFGPLWFVPKMLLHGVIAAMVIWYPHRIVLTMCGAVAVITGVVVHSNFQIAGAF